GGEGRGECSNRPRVRRWDSGHMSHAASPSPLQMQRSHTDEQLIRELIGRNIVRARADAGLTQEQLADQLGADRTQVSQWERGRRQPSWSYLIAIADALGHTGDLSWLLHEEPAPASAP